MTLQHPPLYRTLNFGSRGAPHVQYCRTIYSSTQMPYDMNSSFPQWFSPPRCLLYLENFTVCTLLETPQCAGVTDHPQQATAQRPDTRKLVLYPILVNSGPILVGPPSLPCTIMFSVPPLPYKCLNIVCTTTSLNTGGDSNPSYRPLSGCPANHW